MTTEIRSFQNQYYRRWRSFAANPERAECPWVPVEGRKQVSELARTERLALLVYCSDLFSPSRTILDRAEQSVRVSAKLFSRLSDVKSAQGVLGFFSKPERNWEDLTPYVLYLDRIQDPGNLGTLLRTAAATGMFSIVTSPGTVSCFNRKVVRASSGYLFSVPCLQGFSIRELKKKGYSLIVAHPGDGSSVFDVQLSPPLALVLGSEGSGVEDSSMQGSEMRVHLPMKLETNSLNVAVAGSILMYEVLRRKEL